MPIIKSAKKRVRVAAKANDRNAVAKATLRSSLKKFHAALTSKKNVAAELNAASSAIDQAAKKGIMHKNKAARKKSQLASAAKKASVTVSGDKKAKPAAKKVAPKAKATTKPKAPAKKPAAKKAPAKKPAAKK